MKIAELNFGGRYRAAAAGYAGIRKPIAQMIQTMARWSLVPTVACLFSGCSTGPGSTTNPAPPAPSWSVSDQTTHGILSGLVPAGTGFTVFITTGDDYIVTFKATSSSGIKTTTLSGSGEVICNNNQPPYNEEKPFKYSIPAQTITLSPLPNGQVFTEGVNPFFFFWAPTTGQPALYTPASSAYTACGSQVPLRGTTTYTGQATTDAGVSSAASSISVTTCASGLVSSPGSACN